ALRLGHGEAAVAAHGQAVERALLLPGRHGEEGVADGDARAVGARDEDEGRHGKGSAGGKSNKMGMTGRAWDVGFPTETHPPHAKAVGRHPPSEGEAPVRGCVKNGSRRGQSCLTLPASSWQASMEGFSRGKPAWAVADRR